jgi:hypothetical protein
MHWIIVVDLDEFIYSRRGFTTIKEYLTTLPSDVHKIHIPWKLFGSSGFKHQPPSIIQHFIHRRNYINQIRHILVGKKSIVRGKHLIHLKK